jgi:predicted DNA-binding transcriptional regulator AlpA
VKPAAETRKQPLAKPAEVAEVLGVEEKTLANWRSQGKGPKYRKPGGKFVRYDWADVNAWLAEQPAGTA